MVRINLAPGERRSRTAGTRRRGTALATGLAGRFTPAGLSPSLIAGGAGLVLLLGCVFLFFTERRGLESAEAAVIDAQADSVQLTGSIVRVRALENAQQRLAARVELLDDAISGRLYTLQLLETLSSTLPEYTWLEQVDRADLAPDQIRIAGATFANAAVTDYMRGLEASSVLKDITLVGVTRVEKDSISVQGFTLLGSHENYSAIVVVPADTGAAD